MLIPRKLRSHGLDYKKGLLRSRACREEVIDIPKTEILLYNGLSIYARIKLIRFLTSVEFCGKLESICSLHLKDTRGELKCWTINIQQLQYYNRKRLFNDSLTFRETLKDRLNIGNSGLRIMGLPIS